MLGLHLLYRKLGMLVEDHLSATLELCRATTSGYISFWIFPENMAYQSAVEHHCRLSVESW